jgi:hypothetical protein
MIAKKGTFQNGTPLEKTNIAHILKSFKEILDSF